MTDFVSYGAGIASWLLAVLSVTGNSSLLVHSGVIPANHTFIHALWVFTVVIQGVFLYDYYQESSNVIKQHFVLNNVLLFAWQWLVHTDLHALAFVAALFLLLSAATTYFREQTYKISPLRNWFIIHFAVTALPFIIGLYLTVATGWGVLGLPKHILGLDSRNVVLIIHFIVVGGLLLRFGDWGLGLLGAGLALSIGSHGNKHGLGYYGGVTGLILLVVSIYTAYNRDSGIHLGGRDQAPLLG